MSFAHQPAALGIDVAQERAAGASGDECWSELLQLSAKRLALEDLVAVNKQQQQYGGAALQRHLAVLPQPIDPEIEVAGAA